MALALARLAAIAAATLLFLALGVVGAVRGRLAIASGFGHAFSSCLRAVGSRDSRIIVAQSCQTPSNAQNAPRAVSLTAGFGSAKPFFKDFSRISKPPADSM
jgi:hypothetical protein